jgi:hypothetical protein
MHSSQAILVVGGLLAAAIYLRPDASAQQGLGLPAQQIDDPALAECILKHHAVGADTMTGYVIGACQTVVARR